MPLLDETHYIPTQKYTGGEELLEHARMIGRRYGLYDKALFQTEVKGLVWDASACLWVAHTDRGDTIKARFAISAAGPLHRPKLPGIQGIETFKGKSFHSSRWDYNYTGGSTRGNLYKLADKRVGIIGTGATAVQIVPHLGDWAKHVYVFQRTPSSIDVRANRPTDPEWARTLEQGWQKKRMDNFNNIVNGGHEDVDLVSDGWTAIMGKLLARPSAEELKNPEAMIRNRQIFDFQKMENIRARVDSVVKDPATAESLKPWYNQFCKRPCFHDSYLDTFNKPNVTLVDTKGKGVQAITERGVVANDHEYEVDCLIYATGFELATAWTHRSGFDITGVDGLKISDKWSEGALTLHGWATRGFPNCFFVQIVQAALTPNFIHITDEQAAHFAYVLSEVKRRNIKTFQPTQKAEEEWVRTILELGKLRQNFNRECTPGYYNNEGKPSPAAAKNASYGAGALKFIEVLQSWREKGDLDGLEMEKFEDDGGEKKE